MGNGIFLGYKVPGGDEEFAPISTDPLDVINNLTARDISYQCAAFACYGQYCEAKGISSWYYNTEYVSDFCSLYWITWLRSGSILVAATGVSKIVEESIEYVAQSLALWEKHWTQQATEHSTAVKCFSASLFNMLLILIIVVRFCGAAAARGVAARLTTRLSCRSPPACSLNLFPLEPTTRSAPPRCAQYGRIQGVPASGLLNMPFFFGGKYTDFSRGAQQQREEAFAAAVARLLARSRARAAAELPADALPRTQRRSRASSAHPIAPKLTLSLSTLRRPAPQSGLPRLAPPSSV